MVSDLSFIAAVLVALAFFAVGLIGTFLPVLPGLPILWMGLVIFQLWQPDYLGWTFIGICAGLAIIGQILDLACGYWGARRFGASWKGGVGALIGGIVGFFIPPPLLWLLIGPIIGAIIGECLEGKALKQAGKAGVGTLVGTLAASILKLAMGLFMIGWFTLRLLDPAAA